jgi:hypothetical protein
MHIILVTRMTWRAASSSPADVTPCKGVPVDELYESILSRLAKWPGTITMQGAAPWGQLRGVRRLVLRRGDAPALWAQVERIGGELHAPAPHQVLLGGEMGVSVRRLPRFGIPGFSHTTVTVGLPLPAALTADEFRFVLAAEYARAAGVHHRVDADREGARVAGSGAGAAALCRREVASRFLHDVFWPSVTRTIGENPHAPADVFRRLLREAPDAVLHPDAARWLAEGAAARAEPRDPHRPLAERLAALGAGPALPATPARSSAAEAFLGEHAPSLADRLGRRWADTMEYNWRQQHDRHRQMAQRLAALQPRGHEPPRGAAEARERLLLTVQVHGAAAAMPLMHEFAAAGHDDAEVRLVLGRTLLEEGDEAGLRHLERAMQLDPGTTGPACAAAAAFLHARGRRAGTQAFRRRARAHQEIVERNAGERDERSLSRRDRFLPHGLGEAEVRALSTHLSGSDDVRRGLLVRKEVTVFPERPCYVLLVETVAREWWRGQGYVRAQQVFSSLGVSGDLLILEVGVDDGGWLEKAIAQVPGAEIFYREAPAGAH